MSEPRNPAPRPRRFAADAQVTWAIVGAVIVAMIVALAILLTRPAPVEAPQPTGSPAASNSGTGIRVPSRPARLTDGTWWRVDWRDASGVRHENELRVGRLDGTVTASLVLRPSPDGSAEPGYGPPFVRGPAADQVLVVAAGVGGVAIDRIDARSGAVSRLAVVQGDVPDATLARDGRHAYYLLSTDRGLAAVRIATDGSGAALTVAGPRPRLARAEGIVLAAILRPTATIATSDDERWLVIADCLTACSVRIVDLASGDEHTVDGFRALTSVTGVSPTGIRLGTRCLDATTGIVADRPCAGDRPQAFDWWLRTGVEVPDGWRVDLNLAEATLEAPFCHAMARNVDGDETVLDALGIFSVGNG